MTALLFIVCIVLVVIGLLALDALVTLRAAR